MLIDTVLGLCRTLVLTAQDDDGLLSHHETSEAKLTRDVPEFPALVRVKHKPGELRSLAVGDKVSPPRLQCGRLRESAT